MSLLSPLKISVQQLDLNKVNKLFYNTEGVKNADGSRYKEAAEYFTKAIDIAPEDSLSYFNRATVKVNLGDITGARLDFASSESCKLAASAFMEN